MTTKQRRRRPRSSKSLPVGRQGLTEFPAIIDVAQPDEMSVEGDWELVAIDAALLVGEIASSLLRRALEEARVTSPEARILWLAYEAREASLVPQDGKVVSCDRQSAAEAIWDFHSQSGEEHPSANRTKAGKKILWLRQRKSPFLSYFHPPEGVVCHRFPKLAMANGCPYDCAYCYLQLTLWRQPFVSLFLNLEDLEDELPRWEKKARRVGKRLLLNAGELGDAIEPFPWFAGAVIGAVAPYPHLSVLLVTKSNRLPQVAGLGPWATCSITLTTSSAAALFEPDAPSPQERLQGLVEATEEAGVGVRVRLDPIIPWGSWQQEYAVLVEEMARQLGAQLELVTLGQLRFTPALLPFVERRCQPIARLMAHAVLEGAKARAPDRERLAVYNFVGSLLDGKGIPWGVCKETPHMIKALGAHPAFQPRRCNCV